MATANPVRTFDVAVDPVTPQDIVVPIACDAVLIVGLTTASLFYRGGAGQPEVEILAGTDRMIGSFAFGSGHVSSQTRLTRFMPGDIVGQLRSGVGTGPVVVVCQ